MARRCSIQARVEDLEENGLLHLAHLGPVLGVEGGRGAACRTSSGGMASIRRRSISTPSVAGGPGGQLSGERRGRGRGRRGPSLPLAGGPNAGEAAASRRGCQLLGELAPLVVLAGEVEQRGPRSRAGASGGAPRDRGRCGSVREAQSASPSRSYRGAADGVALGEVAGQRDPHGQLGLLLRVEAGGPRPGSDGRSRRGRGRPSPRGRWRCRTCGAPSPPANGGPSRAEGTPAPARGRSSRARRWPARTGIPPGRRGRTRNSSPSTDANFLRSRSLRFSSNRLLTQSGQRLPGPFRGIGVGGEVLVEGLADRLVELALGLVLGDLGGVLEGGPRKSRPANSTPSRWPTHSAKLAAP